VLPGFFRLSPPNLIAKITTQKCVQDSQKITKNRRKFSLNRQNFATNELIVKNRQKAPKVLGGRAIRHENPSSNIASVGNTEAMSFSFVIRWNRSAEMVMRQNLTRGNFVQGLG